jgi:hypothetical protein
MNDTFDNEDTDDEMMKKIIVAEGGDPAISVPLLDLFSTAALSGAAAKLDGDHVMAAIQFGRVAGLLDAFAALGQPLPVERASDALRAAEAALTNPDEFALAAEAATMTLRDLEGEG